MMTPTPDELQLVTEAVRKSIAFGRTARADRDEFIETMDDLGARWRDLLHDDEIRGLLETGDDILPGRRLTRAWVFALEDLEDGGMEISPREMLAALTYLATIFPSEDWRWEVVYEALRAVYRR